MKVILTADVYKHGVAGEVVDVANGFARNYLIPQGLAVKATQHSLQESEEIRSTAQARRAALDNQLNEIARQIDGVEMAFGRRAGTNGKLYGSVTTIEIAEELFKQTGVDINRRRISQQSLRELGEHTIAVRIGSEITPTLKVVIVREEELADYLARKEAGEDVEVESADVPAEMAGDEIQDLIEEAEAVVEQAQAESTEDADSKEEA
jgi:large subunit ribosomal protein L9